MDMETVAVGNGLIDFLLAHAAILAAFGVAILDFLFAVSNLESNGILHGIYVFLKNILNKK